MSATSAPVATSMTTALIASKRASISSGDGRSSLAASPAATSTLRRFSSAAFAACKSWSATAEVETTMAQTTQTAAAKARL